MVTNLPQSNERLLGFKLSGKLHDEDYKQFVPVIEAALARSGKVRLLTQLEDFHGWDLHALWDDIKFATKHCTDVEKIAIVGERDWEKWMTAICKPFTTATVAYFDRADSEKAWAWLAA